MGFRINPNAFLGDSPVVKMKVDSESMAWARVEWIERQGRKNNCRMIKAVVHEEEIFWQVEVYFKRLK